jgi:hypothetical protein
MPQLPITSSRRSASSSTAGRQATPDTKDPNNSPDRFFTPIDHPEIWLKAGDPTIYFSPPP